VPCEIQYLQEVQVSYSEKYYLFHVASRLGL